jgi:hypothetical protein
VNGAGDNPSSLAPLIAQAAKSRRVRRWVGMAAAALAGLVASGGIATGALKVWTWATTREGVVEQNTRIAELERTVGLPRTAPEAQAEAGLRARVKAIEDAEKARALQSSDQQQLYERVSSILCAAAEPRSARRAAAARACVDEYRSLIRGGMLPRPASDKVLESTIPQSTYDP